MVHTVSTKLQSTWFTPRRPNYSQHGSHHVDQTTVNMVHNMSTKVGQHGSHNVDQTWFNHVDHTDHIRQRRATVSVDP